MKNLLKKSDMKKADYTTYSLEKLRKFKSFHGTLLIVLATIAVLYIAVAIYYIGFEGMEVSPLLGIGVLVIFSGSLVPMMQLGAINSELKKRLST